MSVKSISSRSLSELLEMNPEDARQAQKEDIIREKKLQFMSAYTVTKKKINDQEKILQDSLLDPENLDINTIIQAEVEIKNEQQILEMLQRRFVILFPDSKLDVL